MLFASWRYAFSLLMLLDVASGIRAAKPAGITGGASLLVSTCRVAVVLLALAVWGLSAYVLLIRRSKGAEGTSRIASCLRWGSRAQVLPLTIFAMALVVYACLNTMSCTQYKNAFDMWQVHCDDEGGTSDVFTVAVPASALASAKPGVLPGGVPKIIHQTGPSTWIHPVHLKWLKSWKEQNPGWLHIFWTDAEIRKFMASKHPSVLEQFDAYPMTVMRIDMFRAYVLYSYGGVYADIDYEALSPLEPVLKESALTFVESPYKANEDVQNSFMVSSPGHQFWPTFFKMMRQRYESMPPSFCFDGPSTDKGCPVLEVTGPRLLSDALAKYDLNQTQDTKAAQTIPRGAVVLKIAGSKTPLGSNTTHAGIRWDMQPVADHAGMYTFKNAESGFYLNSSAAGLHGFQRDNQWEIKLNSDGTYTVKNHGTGAYLGEGDSTRWQIEAKTARLLPSGPCMFGKAFPNGQPGVGSHHYDDAWLIDIARRDRELKLAMVCFACDVSLALWLAISFFLERYFTNSDTSGGAGEKLCADA